MVAVVEELCCAIERGSLQTRCDSDNASAIFLYEGFRVFRSTAKHDLSKNMGFVNVCIDFETP
jgi:hypothetical protein